jgi:fatty acid synthase
VQYSSAEYHTNNLLNVIYFDEASQQISHNAITIEIAPHGLLQAVLKHSLDNSITNIALTQRGHPDGTEFLLTALGKYVSGFVYGDQNIRDCLK